MSFALIFLFQKSKILFKKSSTGPIFCGANHNRNTKSRERKAGPLITQVFQLGGEAGLLLSQGLDEEEPGLRLLPPVELLLQALRELEQPLPLSALLPLLLFASASLRLLREGGSVVNFAKFHTKFIF